MATRTVKPAGGGQYTTLAAALAAGSSGDTFNCYVGNIGEATTSYSCTITAIDGHNGIDPTTGSYVLSTGGGTGLTLDGIDPLNFTVTGLAVLATATNAPGMVIWKKTCVVDGVLIVGNSGAAINGFYLIPEAENAAHTVRNSIVRGFTGGYGVFIDSNSIANYTATLQNCTSYGNQVNYDTASGPA